MLGRSLNFSNFGWFTMGSGVPIRSKKIGFYLFVTTIIWAMALACSIVPAMMSVMIFDSPDSTQQVSLWILFGAVVSFPLVAAAAIALSWVCYFLHYSRFAIYATLLPLINILAVLVMLTVAR
jgi:hypothetical protein